MEHGPERRGVARKAAERAYGIVRRRDGIGDREVRSRVRPRGRMPPPSDAPRTNTWPGRRLQITDLPSPSGHDWSLPDRADSVTVGGSPDMGDRVADIKLDTLSLKELKKDIARAIDTAGQRQKADAREKVEALAKSSATGWPNSPRAPASRSAGPRRRNSATPRTRPSPGPGGVASRCGSRKHWRQGRQPRTWRSAEGSAARSKRQPGHQAQGGKVRCNP